MYLVSACLVGINCRYNGTSSVDEELIKLMKGGQIIPVCPEVLGGLDTPRTPCEIVMKNDEKRVVNKDGKDTTKHFVEGADKTLKICQAAGINTAILKARSPSCGCSKIYDGNFSGKLVEGNGLTAELLIKNGVKVFSEENWKA